MSRIDLRKGLLLLAFGFVFVVSQIQLQRTYRLPFPPLSALETGPNTLQDVSFILTGFRRLAADAAWVQLLQGMGDYGNDEVRSTKSYPHLKRDTLRVTRIDPYFQKAYLFGAATLAWLKSTNRPDEAIELISEGVRYNPTFWPLRTYAAGIGYMKKNQLGSMVRILEDATSDPDCPTIVKSILANSYKLQKRYADALAIWREILSSEKGRDYHDRAREEIAKLEVLLSETPAR